MIFGGNFTKYGSLLFGTVLNVNLKYLKCFQTYRIIFDARFTRYGYLEHFEQY